MRVATTDALRPLARALIGSKLGTNHPKPPRLHQSSVRALRLVLVVAGVVVLLVPGAGATRTPVPDWPSPGYFDRSAAPGFTAWLAGRLGAPVDPLQPPRWEPLNDASKPDFLRLAGVYVLPLTDGEVRARYFVNGLLSDVTLRSNTSYVAASTNEVDLRALA